MSALSLGTHFWAALIRATVLNVHSKSNIDSDQAEIKKIEINWEC